MLHLAGGFPGGVSGKESTCSSSSVRKESACNAGDLGSVPGWGRSPGEGNGNPLQYSCLRIPWTEEPCRLQSMGLQESDTTERLSAAPTQQMPDRRETWFDSWMGKIPWRRKYSSILTWGIPSTEESGGLQSIGPLELDASEWLSTHTQLISWSSAHLINKECKVHESLSLTGSQETKSQMPFL